MEGFITFVVVFICVMWVLGKLFPRILVWYLKRKMKKGGMGGFGSFGGFANGFGNGFANNANQEPEQNEGDVIISSSAEPQKKVFDKNDGEYIDFEE